MARKLRDTGLTVAALHVVDHQKVWETDSVRTIILNEGGIMGDRHYGLTRNVRRFESAERAGHAVINDRQVSLGDAEDLRAIADAMALPVSEIEKAAGTPVEAVLAGALAVNVLFKRSDNRLNDLIRPGDIMEIGGPGNLTASLRISEYNSPCRQPGAPLLHTLGALGIDLGVSHQELGELFETVAEDRRGWVASVNSDVISSITIGQSAFVQSALLPPSV